MDGAHKGGRTLKEVLVVGSKAEDILLGGAFTAIYMKHQTSSGTALDCVMLSCCSTSIRSGP